MAHRLLILFENRRPPFARRFFDVLAPALTLILTLTLIPAIADPGNTAESGCSGEPSTSRENPGPAVGEGLKVYVDPDTGELLSEPPPGAETLAPDLPAATHNLADVPVETRADGTIVADVGDRYVTELHVEMIDGQLVTCHRPAGGKQPLPSGADIEQKSNEGP